MLYKILFDTTRKALRADFDIKRLIEFAPPRPQPLNPALYQYRMDQLAQKNEKQTGGLSIPPAGHTTRTRFN